MHVLIRPFGNSRGLVIPKPLLAQVGLEDEADLTVENGALVIRKPSKSLRKGWAEAAQVIAQSNEEPLLMGDFANEADEDWQW
jgi:antitoxin MazE